MDSAETEVNRYNDTYYAGEEDDESLFPRGPDVITFVREECQALIDSYQDEDDGNQRPFRRTFFKYYNFQILLLTVLVIFNNRKKQVCCCSKVG